jgi:hypothetical protein
MVVALGVTCVCSCPRLVDVFIVVRFYCWIILVYRCGWFRPVGFVEFIDVAGLDLLGLSSL